MGATVNDHDLLLPSDYHNLLHYLIYAPVTQMFLSSVKLTHFLWNWVAIIESMGHYSAVANCDHDWVPGASFVNAPGLGNVKEENSLLVVRCLNSIRNSICYEVFANLLATFFFWTTLPQWPGEKLWERWQEGNRLCLGILQPFTWDQSTEVCKKQQLAQSFHYTPLSIATFQNEFPLFEKLFMSRWAVAPL